MTKKLFFFNHGVGGNCHSAFIDSTRSKLEEKGMKTVAPSYPNPADPNFDEWKDTFHQFLADNWNGEEIVMIGHSLGGFFTLRLLGECFDEDWTKKLTAVILVAPTATKRPNRRKFYSEEIKWDNILKINFKPILLYSDNDDKVAREHPDYVVEKIGQMAGFEFIEPKGFFHFIMPEAQPVLDAVFRFV
ncbi:hypothetical protein TRFO_19391 [Tritrichomonas foetus]|uniref:Serine hydrolase family protein n=1 Tax=Tritrichomonas foetus TaxID=1144522 RepID=A0A1J4KJK6_9EUKA|nr:hypothetical protein TRFO_19391 [Tritrichomonas foetus]|eukprot:OHT11282.1 hypothetical protein TRFO_19391 [Tritrichomonas foetus]